MNSAEAALAAAAKQWAPPPELTLSQWAETYRRTSREASAQVGLWRTRPYQREPLDAFTDPRVRSIVIMSAVQMLKTEQILNAIGFVIHLDPGPILLVCPRETDCRRFSKIRLAPMIRDSPVLRELVADAKSRDSGNTMDYKTFPGGHLSVAASGSPGNLAALPIRYLFCDEIDKYPHSAGAEGDPISLAEARLGEFRHNSKEIFVCSPTIANYSRIEKAYRESDQREYEVPCPQCGEFQILKFRGGVKIDTGLPSQKKQAESAVYVCEHCKAEWDDQARWKAIEKGRYKAGAPFNGIAGFRVSALCSVNRPLKDIVLKWLRAQGDVERLKTFVNTELAECWIEQGEAPEWETLLDRADVYPSGTVPRGGLFLTAGVDVQRDRLEAEIVAWGRNRESWSVDYWIIEGRTSEPEVWGRLSALLATTFQHENGPELPISLMFIDSGDGLTTNDVYAWARSQPAGRARAIKGVTTGILPVGQPSSVDVTVAGKKIKGGLFIRTVLVGFFKAELYSDLKKRRPTDEEMAQGWTFPPGYCHFPKGGKNYGDEHFKQLTAEQLITRTDKRGRTKREWAQSRPRNEALDCRIYARAAAWDLGIDRFQEKHWAALEKQLVAAPAKPQPSPETPQQAKPAQPQREQKPRWIPKRDDWFKR